MPENIEPTPVPIPIAPVETEAEQAVCACESCAAIIRLDEGENSRQWCEDCAPACESCDEPTLNNDLAEVRLRRRSTGRWCEICRDRNSFQCGDCGHYFCNDLACGRNTSEESVCEGCSVSYFYCDLCNQTCHRDTYGEAGCCRGCSRDEGDNSDLVHSYGYTPRIQFYGKGPVYFGVELEVEAADVEAAAKSTTDLLGSFACLKEDGSITKGFEIVTQPATLAEHYSHWKPFFDNRPRGLKSFDASTCGLHVHVSRKPLSQLAIGKILVFVNNPANREFVEIIAARPSGRWAEYKAKKLSCACKANASRYEAVNLQNDATIEFRIFKGTLKRESVFKAIEFCAAVVAFCQPGERSISSASTLSEFLKFCFERKKEFPHLWKFIASSWIGVKGQTMTELGFPTETKTKQPTNDQTTEN